MEIKRREYGFILFPEPYETKDIETMGHATEMHYKDFFFPIDWAVIRPQCFGTVVPRGRTMDSLASSSCNSVHLNSRHGFNQTQLPLVILWLVWCGSELLQFSV